MVYDTIIIGAGIAGLMAALGRLGRGERVLVLAKGYGATHWSSGCIDLFGEATAPIETIRRLPDARPEHPYTLVGSKALERGLEQLRMVCEAADYPLVGSPERSLLLPTALGAMRPTSLVPTTMVAGESRQLADGRPTLIAGLRKLRDFFPQLIAANLRAQGYQAESAILDMPALERQHEFGPSILARLFEQPAFREQIGLQLANLVRQGGYARIGLPAVLGLKRATEVVRELQRLSGALIFEIPTLPTSVPGMRLFHALEEAVLRAGGRVQIGAWVVRGEAQDSQLTAVYSEAAAREQRHSAQRWVLATGGIAGGGLRAEPMGELRETALGLPVRGPGGRADWFNPRFLADAGHPVFSAGVAVNAELHPLDAATQIVYHNVSVCGSALAGFDPIREGCLEGVAVATGFAAGQL